MLSIIVPTLNEEHYLPYLFTSLMEQEGEFEVIFTDGNSTDNTALIVKEFIERAPFPVKLLHIEQPGLAVQKNEAVKHAGFELMLFLDADVILPTNFIRDSLEQIQQKKLCIAGTMIYSAEPKRYYRGIFWFYSHIYLAFLRWFKPVINGCSMFATKELHHKIGGFQSGVTYEDFLYANQAAAYQRAVILRKVYIQTSARRFYKLSFFEIVELFYSGFYNMYKAEGPGKNRMKRFQSKYGNHTKPEY